MPDHDAPDPQFDATTSRLIRREALRRAAEELNTASPPGLEDALAQISAEVTAEAIYRRDAAARVTAPRARAALAVHKPPRSE